MDISLSFSCRLNVCVPRETAHEDRGLRETGYPVAADAAVAVRFSPTETERLTTRVGLTVRSGTAHATPTYGRARGRLRVLFFSFLRYQPIVNLMQPDRHLMATMKAALEKM